MREEYFEIFDIEKHSKLDFFRDKKSSRRKTPAASKLVLKWAYLRILAANEAQLLVCALMT